MPAHLGTLIVMAFERITIRPDQMGGTAYPSALWGVADAINGREQPGSRQRLAGYSDGLGCARR